MADVDTARSLSGARLVKILEDKAGCWYGLTVEASKVRRAPVKYYGPGWWYVYLEGDDSGRPLIARIAT